MPGFTPELLVVAEFCVFAAHHVVCAREVSSTSSAAYEGTAYGEAVLRMERVTEGAAEGAVGPGAH